MVSPGLADVDLPWPGGSLSPWPGFNSHLYSSHSLLWPRHLRLIRVVPQDYTRFCSITSHYTFLDDVIVLW